MPGWDEFFAPPSGGPPEPAGSSWDSFFGPAPTPEPPSPGGPWGAGGEAVSRLGRSFVSGIGGLGSTLLSAGEFGAEVSPAGLALEAANPERHAQMLEGLRSARATTEAARAVVRPTQKPYFEDVKQRPFMATAERVSESAPSTIAALGATALSGGTAVPGMVMMGGLEGLPAYSESRDQGGGRLSSAAGAIGVGTANAFLERIGARSILGEQGIKAGLKSLARSLRDEGGTEGLQQVTDLMRRYAQGENITVDQAIAEIGESIAVGAASAGAMHPVVGGHMGMQEETTAPAPTAESTWEDFFPAPAQAAPAEPAPLNFPEQPPPIPQEPAPAGPPAEGPSVENALRDLHRFEDETAAMAIQVEDNPTPEGQAELERRFAELDRREQELEVLKAEEDGAGAAPARPDSLQPFHPDQIDQWPDLTPEDRQIERGFAARIAADPEGAVASYLELPDSKGKIINTDIARELEPAYAASDETRATKSSAVHEPASTIAKLTYEKLLRQPAKPGERDVVLFTAGGTGAGKSTGLALMPEAEREAKIIYDTNMAGTKSGEQKIRQALDSGHEVVVAFTYRHPIEALVNGTIPRAVRAGRMVPLDVHISTHVRSLETFRQLRARFADDPRVVFRLIDNSNGKGRVKEVAPDALDRVNFNSEELYDEAAAHVRAAHQEGRIPDAIFAGAKLRESGVLGEPSDRPGGRADEQGPRAAAEPVAPPEAELRLGNEATVHAPGIGPVRTRYALVEASQLQTSHDDQLRPVNTYPQELQNRDRSRATSADQVRQIEQKPIPELLGENPNAADGAPIIGSDLVVEAGNGRVIGMRRASRSNPEGFGRYRAFLEQNAERFGIDPEQLAGMEAPMLVRVREGEVNREAFARASNVRSQAALSTGEVALDDARRMPLELLDYLDEGSTGDVTTAGNRAFVRAFVQRVVPAAEAGQVADARGELSKAGAARMQAAIFAKAYDDPELVGRTFEETDDNAKRIGSGMVAAAPAWAKMRAAQETGELHPIDPTPDLAAAIAKLAELRRARQPVEAYLKQQGMFGQELTPEATRLLEILSGPTGRSQKRVAQFLSRFTELVEAQGNPKQGTLLGAQQAPAALELIEEAERTAERAGERQELLLAGSGPAAILGPLFSNPRGKLTNPASEIAAASKAVEARWQKARGVPVPGAIEKLRGAAAGLLRSFRQAYPSLDTTHDPAHAQVNDSLRRHSAAVHTATASALNDVDSVTQDLTPAQGDLLTRLVALPDLIRAVDEGLYEGKELPFGYSSVAEMQADLGRFEQIAEREENKPVLEAVARRTANLRRVVGHLVAEELVPPEYLDNAEAYYHRQVLNYMDADRRLGSTSVHLHRKGFQRQRKGGGDFNTSFHQAEFEWLRDAYELLAKKETIREIEQHDLGPKLREQAKKNREEAKAFREEGGDPSDADINPLVQEELDREAAKDWRELIPEGYVLWQPTPGTAFYPTLTITEKALDKILSGEVDVQDAEFKKALAVAGPKRQLVLDAGIAEALEQSSALREVNIADHIWVATQRSWKQWTLISPLRVLRYNLNNMSGDLDIALAVDPSILKKAPAAINQLWSYQVRRNAPPKLREKMLRLMELGVLDSGLTVEEIADVSRPTVLRLMLETDQRRLANLVPRYFRFVRNFTVFRENLLRLAAYERALDLVKKSRRGGERPYWTSRRSEVDALYDGNSTDEQLAAKVSREAIGDYGNVSRAGQFIRSRIMPFYSWMEVNAPRYVRLLRNEATTQGKAKIGLRAAAVAGKKAITGTAGLALKASILYGAISLWNHLRFPDEERKMRKSRRELHLILGVNKETGEVNSIRFSGALSDALSWFGLEDIRADVEDIRAGKKTVGDELAEAVKAPVERAVQAWEPVSKTVFELATGRSVYPRVFEEGASFHTAPRVLYDKPGAVARTLSAGPVWDIATNKPRRGGGDIGKEIGQAFNPTYQTDLEESSYWEIRRLQGKFLQERGKGISGGFDKNDRQLALYYWKKAKQYGDEERAKFWLKKYRDQGGTQRGIEQSLKMSAPLGGMSVEDRAAFMRSLTPEDRETLRIASRWFARTMR